MKRDYASLLANTLPAVIRNEAENDRLLDVINQLLDKAVLSPDEEKLLELLTLLTEEYESRVHDFDDQTTPVTRLEFLMEQHGLRQVDLVEVFGSRGRVSDVLSGRRSMSINHAKRLAEKFGVPVDLFI